MKLTKYQHACFVLEKEGASLVVDPGNFSHDFIMPKRIAGIVITHDHPDHFDEKLVRSLLLAHPHATIVAHESISGRFTNFTTIAAKVADPCVVGPFSLRFYGGEHAPIAPSVATPPNLGVLVDNHLYYPGDSFTVPQDVQVQELLIPASAPWLKISDAMNFLSQVRPRFAFPTHDAILSIEGKELADRLLGTVASGQGTQYKRLDSLTVELS